MQNLRDIEGIDSGVVELFEAAGFIEAKSFEVNSAEVIHGELVKANAMLNIVSEIPSLAQIQEWCDTYARPIHYKALNEPDEELVDEVDEVFGTEDTRKRSFAVPLSKKFIDKHNLDVSALPALQVDSAPIKASDKKVEKAEFQVKSIDEFRENGSDIKPLQRYKKEGTTSTPSEEANEGIEPSSQRYVRGVMHTDPTHSYVGALGYLLTLILLVSSFAPVVFIVLNRELSVWGFAAPAVALLALFVYLSVARQTFCPVCRQRQFVPKACRKHVKAHSFPLLGHMLPTALHLILFKWFRCIFCGTSIRVKK